MRELHVYSGSAGPAPAVYLNLHDGDGSDVLARCVELGVGAFSLIAVGGLDWNAELTPWPASALIPGEDFAGRADGYLAELTEEILPAAERLLPAPPTFRALAGYSLAGLFALYALYRTDRFSRAASVSGSLWYPGFEAFARERSTAGLPERVYLSLGGRESRSSDPRLASNLERTAALRAHFAAQGIRTLFEENPGGHFRDPDLRTAKAIRWLLQ